MAIVNDIYGYLYLAEPYTASRSTSLALKAHPGSRSVGQHETLQELLDKGLIDEKDRAVFRVVRNPADWLVTHYHHMTSWHSFGFPAFARNFLEARQTIFRPQYGGVLKYEAINTDLNILLSSLGVPEVKLPWIGITQGKKPYREYYTDDLKELVLKLTDWEAYGYSW